MKRNSTFIRTGQLARLTSKHLFIQQNFSSISEGDDTGLENRLIISNKAYENLDPSEKAVYSDRVKQANLESLRGKQAAILRISISRLKDT